MGALLLAGAAVRLEDSAETRLISGAGCQLTYAGTGIALCQMALHTIGHALGLGGQFRPRLHHVLRARAAQPAFEHDFGHVVYDAPQHDADLGLPDLHRVRRAVSFRKRLSCLPPDLFGRYAETAFWRAPGLNARGVPIL